MSCNTPARPEISAMNAAVNTPVEEAGPKPAPKATPSLPREIGGPKGPEPTRYGDWEVKGRCSDF